MDAADVTDVWTAIGWTKKPLQSATVISFSDVIFFIHKVLLNIHIREAVQFNG